MREAFEKVKVIIDGWDPVDLLTCCHCPSDEGEKGQCLIAKEKNGWQLETLSTFKTVYFKKLENTKCTKIGRAHV